MSRLNAILASRAAVCLLLACATPSRAEEVEKRFRLAVSVGGYNTSDEVHSAAGNRRTLFNPNGEFEDRIVDPRNDSGALSDFGIEPQYGGVLSASYAINRLWYVEASAGYRRGTVGNVEVQAQFNRVVIPVNQTFNFSVFNLDGGKITQVPLQVTGGIRFRPKAALNPFLCAGVGYTFISFEPSDEINELSLAMSTSTGGFARLAGTQFSGHSFDAATTIEALRGITVDVSNEPEWHAGGGLEYSFKRQWVAYFDARYTVYSGRFNMIVNGSGELGISVPSDQIIITAPDAFGPFGAVSINSGGIIDGGSIIPKVGFEGTDCTAEPGNCVFAGPPDGVNDPGYYYVHAGKIRYDGASFQIGMKFTF